MKPTPIAQALVKWSTDHAINLLTDNHVELRWEWTYVKMRMADLLIVHQALQDWFEVYDSTDEYQHIVLRLADSKLYFRPSEFEEFARLIKEGVDVLPRKVVWWADLEVEILAHSPSPDGLYMSAVDQSPFTSFSIN